MGRSPCCSKEGLSRGAWTKQEDMILSEYIRTHGDGGWRNLPQNAGLNRCGKSCRLRWLNYIRPDIKHGNISLDEDELIIRLHRLLGNRWSLIAGRLPGRTDNEIKNYWNTHLSKNLQSMNESQPNSSTQSFKRRSKSPSPVQNQVFKTTPVRTTAAVGHSGLVRPNHCNGYVRSNCRSGQAFKLCNLKETASFSKSWSDQFVKDSITDHDPEPAAFGAADINHLQIAEPGNSTCSMLNPHYFGRDAATLAEDLLDLHHLSAPECDLLSSPSDCLTVIGLEELYRAPAILAADLYAFDETCFDEGNMRLVNSFTMAGYHRMEELYNINSDIANWIDEL